MRTLPSNRVRDTKPIILILGPTASGKTELAIAIAQRLGGECVCADSMQVYRGMDIGTAKPTAAQQAQVPHHLLDLLDPSEEGFSVDRWLALAEEAIEAIRGGGGGGGGAALRAACGGSESRPTYPIVVGGTNLYVQALLEGLADGPAPDYELRERLNAADQDSLRGWLERVDPAAAERIHPNDRKRTVRAIEVFERSGRRISDMQQQRQWLRGEPRRDVRIIGLDFSIEAINRRINARVKAMIEAGLVDEVRRLLAGRGLGRQAAEALGYKQIRASLEGDGDLEAAIEQIRIQTRRFARQQRTWLRRFRAHPRAVWLDAAGEATQELVESAIRVIDAAGPAAGGSITADGPKIADGAVRP